ncbi:PQQ-binding-like beta-propeller repeat protein [Stackebrandtia albiflava]|uniref:outer membrane protein assembly factor BamB family protein n=1 Tax=Stackebrandtia albiflava TaxID=406432 RepID=UPI00131591EE|nr:PQQ-binding-like beta-propeller repeat protein [Stackebrandtia albiflava]
MAILSLALAGCGLFDDGADDAGSVPVWEVSLPEDVDPLSLVGFIEDRVVVKTTEGIWFGDASGDTDWQLIDFERYRDSDTDEILAGAIEVGIFQDQVTIAGHPVGVVGFSASGSEIFRLPMEDSRLVSAAMFQDSVVGISCLIEDERACSLEAFSGPSGTSLWRTPLELDTPILVAPANGPQSLRTQTQQIRTDSMTPSDVETVFVAGGSDNATVHGYSVADGAETAVFDTSYAQSQQLRPVGTNGLLEWSLPNDGCVVSLKAWDGATGETAWDLSLLNSATELANVSTTCAGHMVGPRVSQGHLITVDTEGRPTLTDPATGRAVWQGQAGDGLPVGYGAEVIVLATPDGDSDEVRGLDIGTGEELWTFTAPPVFTRGWPPMAVGATKFVFEHGDSESPAITVLDLRTGESATLENQTLVSVQGVSILTQSTNRVLRLYQW